MMKIERVKEILDQFPNKRVAVIGDFYLDEYLHCSAEKFSPEAPVPRVVINKREHLPGCAGNIAVALRSLGAQVSCIGIIGNDEKGMILRNKLLEQGIITTGLFSDATRLTGIFSRILLANDNVKQHFIRFDLENKDKISSMMYSKLIEFMDLNLSNIDLLFVADYDETQGTGLITPAFVENIVKIAEKYSTFVIGISRLKIKTFKKFNVLVCNKKEAGEAAAFPIIDSNSLRLAAEKLLAETEAKTIIITQGRDGLAVLTANSQFFLMPSYVKNVVDACGAGDALSSAFALCSLTAATEEEKAFISSHAAAVAVSKLGTAAVFPQEIMKSVSPSFLNEEKVIRDHQKLVLVLEKLKKESKKIVFTNGYFDLIHSGHIDFLHKSKNYGDILVVAINSDRSTLENKGEGRPILNELERLKIISSLDSVDFVTVFDESTPLKIISLLKPSILTKGGKYENEEIVGKDLVENSQGEVRIIQTDCFTSTESVINKIIQAKK